MGKVASDQQERVLFADSSPAVKTFQLHNSADKLLSHLKLYLNVVGRVLDLVIYRSQCASTVHSSVQEEGCNHMCFVTLIQENPSQLRA